MSCYTKGVAAHCRDTGAAEKTESLTGLTTGCLHEKPEVGQRSSLGDLGRNKCGNTEWMKRANHV